MNNPGGGVTQKLPVFAKYAVKEYQLLNVRAQSGGFDWGTKNFADWSAK